MEHIHAVLVMTWNILIFGVDNASSFHADNCQNNFLVLGEKPTNNIDGSVAAAKA